MGPGWPTPIYVAQIFLTTVTPLHNVGKISLTPYCTNPGSAPGQIRTITSTHTEKKPQCCSHPPPPPCTLRAVEDRYPLLKSSTRCQVREAFVRSHLHLCVRLRMEYSSCNHPLSPIIQAWLLQLAPYNLTSVSHGKFTMSNTPVMWEKE